MSSEAPRQGSAWEQPTTNPFLGLEIGPASDIVYRLSEAATKGCRKRPTLPHETEEAALWFFVGDGEKKYEERMKSIRTWWREMGYDEDAESFEVVQRE